MSTPTPNYSGMTTNERLSAAGLLGAFDSAIDAGGRETAIEVLGHIGLQDQAAAIVGAILDDPKLDGFPRSK